MIGGESREHVNFLYLYRDGEFSGQVRSSSYLVDPVSVLFEDMAANWRGWAGEKKWSDLEQAATLSATSDSTGHISLVVKMRSWPFRRIEAALSLEAGSLDRIAANMKSFFGASP